ncbi:MAG: ribosome maturation factor RimM [Candidatus Latescibacterota bacterium]
MSAGEEIYLGQLGRPFGIKGELKLVPSQDFWEGVLDSKNLILRTAGEDGVDTNPIHLKHFRRQNKFYVLEAEGIGDRSAADALVGGELFIPADELDVDYPDEVLPFQIVGCSVRSEDGDLLGEITSVLFTPGHDVYEVAGDKGRFLVPAVPEFVISMDTDERQIVIRPIPGLMDDSD